MICIILGYENDSFANETILGFIHKIAQSTKFNYVDFLSEIIHEQLVHFEK
jgi:hypothetical protein